DIIPFRVEAHSLSLYLTQARLHRRHNSTGFMYNNTGDQLDLLIHDCAHKILAPPHVLFQYYDLVADIRRNL
ncbi:hypothetical protein QCD79_27405, partial [Pseudomonas quasicaspiana]|nr:hypothetical protein [Pseudomonas quasicaspiana]